MRISLNTNKRRATKKGRAEIADLLESLAEDIRKGDLVLTDGFAMIEMQQARLCVDIKIHRGFAHGGAVAHHFSVIESEAERG